jgi:hypothetical protein
MMSGVRLSRAYLSDMVDRDCGPIVFLSSGIRLSSESALNVPADPQSGRGFVANGKGSS